jgi:hypothetical protein
VSIPDPQHNAADHSNDGILPGPDAGGGCQTGCSISSHPIEPLTATEYMHFVERFANGVGDERDSALETLLFHGEQSRRFMDKLGVSGLDEEQSKFLRRELSRTHARMWLRLVDENGIVRAKIDGARMPIGKKEHVAITQTDNLQPPEASGTVHRTGLHHLWTRI